MNRKIIRVAVVGALALAVSATVTGPAQAVPAPASIGINVGIINTTDPPGDCRRWEAGQIKLGPDGAFYKCTYVPGEGWYWLPW